jgi:NAD(P)-dependent dehydrogenase (short-subunit alcohol dehydrogenase family)
VDLELTNRRAIVTGASRGIGLAIARELAREGVDLVVAARTEGPLSDAAELIAKESGRRVIPVTVDTGDDASVRALVDRAVQELGGVDILVNSAARVGLQAAATVAETTDELFWDDVNVKVVGYLRTARAVAPLMTAQGWGRIINISGLGARKTNSIVRTIRNVSVAALTKNLADELGSHGVNVTVVHPGVTRTERSEALFAEQAAARGIGVQQVETEFADNAIGRVVDAQEVAWVVAFLASPKSVSISGDAVAVGGGTLGSVYY